LLYPGQSLARIVATSPHVCGPDCCEQIAQFVVLKSVITPLSPIDGTTLVLPAEFFEIRFWRFNRTCMEKGLGCARESMVPVEILSYNFLTQSL